MTAALEVLDITKSFGNTRAVDQVSFSVERGEICGFIGPNGAGKTTTMRIVATLDLPDTGEIMIDGVSAIENARGVRGRIGFMPDSYGAYGSTTVVEYLDFFARAHGLRGKDRKRTMMSVIDFTALQPLVHKKIDALSKGMKQRLCLAKTLLHDPALLILDEPAAGLDPRARVELRELVTALAENGKAVLLSSHILTELSEVCDSVAVIEAGRLMTKGSVHEMTRGSQAATQIALRVLGDIEAARLAVAESRGADAVRLEGDAVVFSFAGDDSARAALLADLVRRGIQPIDFAARTTNLEDVFMSVTKGTIQ